MWCRRSFLEDGAPPHAKGKGRPAASVDSDSDREGRAGNPLVADFQDDLDPGDRVPARSLSGAVIRSTDVALSVDEDDRQPMPAATRNDTDKQSRADASSSGNPVTRDTVTKTTTDSKPPPKPPSTQPASHAKKTGGAAEAESSDTDPEAPVARQLLSFVMDDPDFESEGSDTQIRNKDFFPVRDDLSDLSDEELPHPLPPAAAGPPKPSALCFRKKDDTDLFGLGFEDVQTKARESSEECEGEATGRLCDRDPFQTAKGNGSKALNGHLFFPLTDKLSKHSSKDKKKKKKIKEDEEKNSRKRHKHKKKVKEEASTVDDKEKKKKKSRSKKGTDVDDLEAFLAGGAGPTKATPGEYEEL
ncbi:rab-like protein 6-like [Arapaima gigas]